MLLHGHPRTGATWHRVAPLLVADGFTVVIPDLRGYGRSTAPAPRPDHAQASKRALVRPGAGTACFRPPRSRGRWRRSPRPRRRRR
ncbi:alpha/beta fold hydrolase [Leifsonia xyli]|uniref:alpha/beta fold hydrolase n=1 Tax=Leifsonia xyli TaxID=1575 RepID=UPI003D66A06D